jgi:hypothetical protein
MPTPTQRPSLTTTLDVRYAKQHSGGAFEVKNVLGQPGTEPLTGEVIDAASQLGATFQAPNGFQVRVLQQVSQLKAVQSGDTQGLSTYVYGLDTTRYHP